MGEYKHGIPTNNHYIIIPASDLGKLLIFNDIGLCVELIIFDLPANYRVLNPDHTANIPIILDDHIVSHKIIINNNTISEYDSDGKRLIHFEKLDNDFYLVGERKISQSILPLYGTIFYTRSYVMEENTTESNISY